ncbi:MAG: phosphomannomutase/phosphoglucomutase [Actinomycetota bacterium]
MSLDAIFKAYDVRGVYPDEFDETAARNIGGAFADFAGAPAILVGRDMRVSSEPMAKAFIDGVTARGVDAVDLGLVSTDLVYFASGIRELPGAMFTASHNPPRYNGTKFCLRGAAPVGQDTGLGDIKQRAERGLEPAAKRGAVSEADLLDAFADHLLGLVETSAMSSLTVAIDAANGMAGKVAPAVFDRLPMRVVPLFFELDGTFPNHPADPIQQENLEDLRRAVLAERADVGLAFDGDADRVFLVDEKAEPVSGSLTTALVAKRILTRDKAATIVHNLICSRVVGEVIAEGGGKAVRSRVGHSFIKQLMAETGAAFGGEHSGHYYFRDNFRADSGMLAALYVLETMSLEGKPLSELLAPLRRYAASGEINVRVDDQQAAIERIAQAYADGSSDRLDGLTVSYDDWWFNVRPSNTEPLLRLNVEANDESLMKTKRDELVAHMKGS